MSSLSRRALLGGAVIAGAAAACTACTAQAGTAAPSPSSPSGRATDAVATPSASAASASPAASTGFDRSEYSLDDPRSIWVIVDKKRPLQPKSWIPPDLVQPDVPHTNVPQLRRVAAKALETMFAGARSDGIGLVSLSAYRSFQTQTSIFDRNLVQLGRATTLNLTAKPGYSEHQTGLADDIGDGGPSDLQVAFEKRPAAKWLSENSWRFGWVQRYPLGYTAITGIQVEPWHFRYIGKPAAAEVHRTHTKTLEQFFGLPASPTY